MAQDLSSDAMAALVETLQTSVEYVLALAAMDLSEVEQKEAIARIHKLLQEQIAASDPVGTAGALQVLKYFDNSLLGTSFDATQRKELARSVNAKVGVVKISKVRHLGQTFFNLHKF